MIEKIKELRVEADATHQLLSEVTDKPSTEINRALMALILGKAWLGKLLGEFDSPSPYPKDGTRKTVKDIEPTADRFEGEKVWGEDATHISKIDVIRQRIQVISETTKTMELGRGTWGCNVARTSAYNSFCEARFWLGFEFERIRKETIKIKK